MFCNINSYLLLFSLFFCCSFSDEILGCGGFIKSDVPIDFSKIEIQLYTSEGLLKYQTECAPNNGYYMVPYIEKGNFVLKIDPPSGWQFEPMSVLLNVDGVNDDCSKGNDINFIFKGFFVSGQISSLGASGIGPKDVTVELHSLKSSGPLKTTKSIEKGAFSFEGVLPGEYRAFASSNSYSFIKRSSPVVVKNSNTKCQVDLVVSGYNIQGHVTVQSKPVPGVQLLLYAKKKIIEEIKECNKLKPAIKNIVHCPGFPVFICTVTSNDKYLFENLPAAQYAIVPFHKGRHMQYDIEPHVLEVTVLNDHVTSMTDFQVTGYSVQGRVLTHKGGLPIQGAEVLANGRLQDTTDTQGFYTIKHKYADLNGGSDTRLELHIKKEDLEFLRQDVRLDPNASLLPTIFPQAFSVCGLAEIADPPSGFDVTHLGVEIFAVGGDKPIQQTSLDKKGLFCFMKPAGKYNLKIVVPKSLEEKGLVVLPTLLQVKVDFSPVKNIVFHQHRADCSICVTCIDSCKGVLITLTSAATGKIQKVLITDSGNHTIVHFRSVLPGEYTVSPHRDHWCWVDDSKQVVVSREGGNSPVEIAKIKQSGFLLVCSISHDIEMVIHHDGDEVNSFSLKKGRNRMCLSHLGKYTLEPRSCHRFDAPTPIIYDTTKPRSITLHAVAHQATAALVTTDAYLASELKEDKIAVQVRSSSGKVTKEYFIQEDVTETKGEVIFQLTHWASDGETLELRPTSNLLLFDPPTLSVTMRAGDCSKELARFKGIVGIFIDGYVTPALANVNIVIFSEANETITLKTGKDGTYRIGPLYPGRTYNVSASLEDYAMTAIKGKKNCFLAKKLSKVIFKISLEGTSTPLPGVLLSISGGSYRSNNLTAADGSLLFTGLKPGSYYFKAIMKEFQFDPPSQVLEVVEGAKTEVKISGKRVTFSAYGAVTSLNGEPEVGVQVRALSRGENDQCRNLGEEALTESEGRFRVRGLRPGCTYDLSVRDKDGKFSRVAPGLVSVNVREEDSFDIRFIAFRPLTGFELSGYVATSIEHLPFVKVALYRAGEGVSASPVHVVSLTKETPFFQFPSIPRDGSEYMVKLESSLPVTMYDYTAPAAGFFAVGPHKHVSFHFQPLIKPVESEISQSSIMGLPLALLVMVLVYYHETIFNWLLHHYRLFTKKNAGTEISGRNSRKPKK